MEQQNDPTAWVKEWEALVDEQIAFTELFDGLPWGMASWALPEAQAGL